MKYDNWRKGLSIIPYNQLIRGDVIRGCSSSENGSHGSQWYSPTPVSERYPVIFWANERVNGRDGMVLRDATGKYIKEGDRSHQYFWIEPRAPGSLFGPPKDEWGEESP